MKANLLIISGSRNWAKKLMLGLLFLGLMFGFGKMIYADGTAWTYIPFQEEIVITYQEGNVFAVDMVNQLKGASYAEVLSSNPEVADALVYYEDPLPVLWVMTQGKAGTTTFTVKVVKNETTNVYRTKVTLIASPGGTIKPFNKVKVGDYNITGALNRNYAYYDLSVSEGEHKISIQANGGWKIKNVRLLNYLTNSEKTIKNNTAQYFPEGDTCLRITMQNKNNKMVVGYSVWVEGKKVNASVSLNKASISLVKGNTEKLSATLKNIKGRVKWSSSNKAVATVSSKGKITARKAGTVLIKATVGKYSASCKVTVKNPTIKVSQSSCTLQKGKSFTLKAVVNGKSNKVTWTSSNKKVCTVSKKGILKAKKAGTAVITAKANGVKTICKVYVNSSMEELYLNLINKTLQKEKESGISFALYDFDHDGIKELLIDDIGSNLKYVPVLNSYEYVSYDLYTIWNGKLKLAGHIYSHWISALNGMTGNIISSSDGGHYVYQYKNGECKMIDSCKWVNPNGSPEYFAFNSEIAQHRVDIPWAGGGNTPEKIFSKVECKRELQRLLK